MEVDITQQGPDILTILVGIAIFVAVCLIIAGVVAYFWRFIVGHFKFKAREDTSLKYVLLQVTVPKDNEIKIDAAEQLFATFSSLKKSGGWFARFKPQTHI